MNKGMERKDYIDLKGSKLLKQLHYPVNNQESHWVRDDKDVWYWMSAIGAYDVVNEPKEYWERPKISYPVVTLQEVCKWLRTEFNYFIDVRFDHSGGGYWWSIKNIGTGDIEKSKESLFETYEESTNNAIYETLKLIIDENI